MLEKNIWITGNHVTNVLEITQNNADTYSLGLALNSIELAAIAHFTIQKSSHVIRLELKFLCVSLASDCPSVINLLGMERAPPRLSLVITHNSC